ncbi:hypothetical protein DP113_29280 [Brasilonema octagenarum UFV-E1]|uniref:DUF1822 family protein n=3 Tax=Scytonemataceae TaxID=1182 RepID=A0A856MMS8_9CYAN|nr:hypothetical protein [Brasilonema octagenarum UFV-OR1]QDL11414.1 hypothetical protein DP114_29085 [Brasilonema sennae CENA114]QDL17805.1 hypothetical protein DP113_29280 [Brasilonema octagenarum UFV-E1]
MATISTFTGPISTVARRLAEKCSRQQATPEKSQQVLLNTLSVSFVNFYLDCMGFETDTYASDSWNPVQQTLMDVADLLITNLGKLECRPVLENAQFVYVPQEVQSNRIGYVAVEISEDLQSAKLLGFVKEVSIEYLPINQLNPLENLLNYLESLQLQTTKDKSQNLGLSNQNLGSSSQSVVNFKRWFENIFDSGWSTIESIFLTEPVWQFRSAEDGLKNSVERAKLIDFGIKANRESVGIVVKVSHDESNCDEMKIIVELHPTNGQEYLPSSLHVMILDEEGTAVMEAKAKNDNKKIALEFNAAVGDNFSVNIALENVSVVENFVV